MQTGIRLLTALAVMGAGASLAACGQPDFVDVPPPPPPYADQPPYKPGPDGADKPGAFRDGPPPEQNFDRNPPGRLPPSGLSAPLPPQRGGQPQDRFALGAPDFEPFRMAPIPNPEDLTPADRAKIYGPGERAERDLPGGPARRGNPPVPAKPTGDKPVAAKPAAPKSTAKPVAPAAPAPVAKKPAAPAPQASAPAPKAQAPKATTPVTSKAETPKAEAKAPAAKARTKGEQLGQALAGDIESGSQFDTGALAEGNEGVVTLTLPPSLFARLRAEAAKLGLGPNARNADATATLSGEGYDIQPNGAQTVRLKDDEAARFSWNVRPLDNASGKLGADVGARLKGAGKAEDVHLATLEQQVGPEPEEPSAINGLLTPRNVGFGLLGLLALIIIGAVLRSNGARRRSERSRKARAAASFGEYGGNATEQTTTTTEKKKT